MSELEAALPGGFIGGALGVVSTLVASYFGPCRLEQWRADIKKERDYGPRKRLLKEMLAEPNPPIRTFQQLGHVTGTTDEECRRLLRKKDPKSPASDQALMRMVWRVCKRAGVRRLSPHQLRHGFANRFLRESGRDFVALQALMGHSRPTRPAVHG